jgi:hypothetical protein
LVVTESAPWDTAAISKAYADGYGQIGKFMAKNKLQRADVSPGDNVRVIQSYAGKALKTTHVGPYDTKVS